MQKLQLVGERKCYLFAMWRSSVLHAVLL